MQIKKNKNGRKDCFRCGGTGSYKTYTDAAGEDGGGYTTTHTCSCVQEKDLTLVRKAGEKGE